MKRLRIAICQINTTIGDLEGNTKKILRSIKKAQKISADIAVFPELSISGYPPEDLLLKSQFITDNLKCLDLIKKEVKSITAIVGFIDRQNALYNAAAIINEGEIRGVCRKMCLPNYGVFDEKRYFAQGKNYTILTVNNIDIGINICEDIWVPGKVTEVLVNEGGAEAILNLSSSPYHVGKLKIRERMLSTRAADNTAAIVYVNLVGGQDELIFDGGSMVFDHKGNLTARARQFREDFLPVDLNLTKVKDDRILIGYRKDTKLNSGKRKKIIRTEITARTTSQKKSPVGVRISPHKKHLEEIYNALALGTKDYVRKNGFQKVLIGISGGIDSALTAVIAVDALGSDNVVLISMPSKISSKETTGDAKKIAKNLGTKFHTIPIENILKKYEDELSGILSPEKRIVIENLQARIRGNILMGFSNRYGWLVLTTGNKSETSVGYSTLYGDTAGGFAVIKDIAKTTVYELARYRNKKARRELIPKRVIEREPSAELSPNQKDSDSIPPYDILDPILKAYVEEDKSIDEIAAMGYDRNIVRDVLILVDVNEYKRRQSPIGIKITQKAFGKDRRLPVTNKYRYRYK